MRAWQGQSLKNIPMARMHEVRWGQGGGVGDGMWVTICDVGKWSGTDQLEGVTAGRGWRRPEKGRSTGSWLRRGPLRDQVTAAMWTHVGEGRPRRTKHWLMETDKSCDYSWRQRTREVGEGLVSTFKCQNEVANGQEALTEKSDQRRPLSHPHVQVSERLEQGGVFP